MANVINFGGGGTGEDVLLIPKTITENGRYLPSSDSADGYSEVTVNVNSGLITLDLTPITVELDQGE